MCLALRIGDIEKRAEECVLVSQPNVSACFESLSSTVQSAETIQESIGAHYTLKLIQKENKNSVSKNIQLVRQ
ncbi:hypothetical protein DMH20_07060 [Escherichia coli]|nr:hypothetical protein [Escherichia coli]